MAELSQEAREVRAKYLREWRKRHPGKQKEYTRRYLEKKAREASEQKGGEVA